MVEQQSPHYVLVIGEKENAILSIFLVLSLLDKARFNMALSILGITHDELNSFIADMSAKEHAMDWCKDPNCKYEKKV